MKNSTLVYSTAGGRICPQCSKAVSECICKKQKDIPTGDGIVRVRREVKGRKGKTVTLISGVPLPESDLRELATDLKRKTGSGGSVKDGIIIIQGDHCNKMIAEIKKLGYPVK